MRVDSVFGPFFDPALNVAAEVVVVSGVSHTARGSGRLGNGRFEQVSKE